MSSLWEELWKPPAVYLLQTVCCLLVQLLLIFVVLIGMNAGQFESVIALLVLLWPDY